MQYGIREAGTQLQSSLMPCSDCSTNCHVKCAIYNKLSYRGEAARLSILTAEWVCVSYY